MSLRIIPKVHRLKRTKQSVHKITPYHPRTMMLVNNGKKDIHDLYLMPRSITQSITPKYQQYPPSKYQLFDVSYNQREAFLEEFRNTFPLFCVEHEICYANDYTNNILREMSEQISSFEKRNPGRCMINGLYINASEISDVIKIMNEYHNKALFNNVLASM
jgi:hypothetical protein